MRDARPTRVRSVAVMAVWLGIRLCGHAAAPAPTDLGFVYRDGFMWVDVEVPGRSDRLKCLFDTGSDASVLNLGVARSLGVSTGRRAQVKGVRSDAAGYWLTLPWAKLGHVPLKAVFLAVDLREISDACDEEIEALVGADFLRGRVVQLDFEARRIRVLDPDALSLEGESVPLRVGRGGILVPVSVNDSAVHWVRLDTGCSSALHWVTPSGPASLACRGPAPAAIALNDSHPPADRATVQVGTVRLTGVPVTIHRQELFPGESGLLGNGLLSRFSSVIIDTRSNRLILKGIRTSD